MKNDFAHQMYVLNKRQRDLERNIGNYYTNIRETYGKFDVSDTSNLKKGRKPMKFKCSTCNEGRWNKLPELKATAQAKIQQEKKGKRPKRRRRSYDSDFSFGSSIAVQ